MPKEGKDHTLVSNYHPISLLNVDTKPYTKILSNCLLPLLPSLVAKDQVGFVPGWETRDNNIKALYLHSWLTSSKQTGFFFSLNTEMAFDRVACNYMAALKHA